jgi:hypothetical protein
MDPEKDTIRGDFPMFFGKSTMGRTLTDANQRNVWKFSGPNKVARDLKLAPERFPGNLMCVWEYGPGDEVILQTRTIIERKPDGTYAVESDADPEWKMTK